MAYIIKFLAALIVLGASFAANPESNMIARLGLESGSLIVAAVSLALAGLLCMRHTAFLVVTLIAAILGNAPASLTFGISPDIFAAAFVALLVIPVVLHYID
jgi:hypothetical protein